MKKIVLILFVPLFLSFVSFAVVENDLQQAGLKGDVKSVTTVNYEAALKFDELVKGKRSDSTIESYNANGMRTTFIHYSTSSYIPDYELKVQFNAEGKESREILTFNPEQDYDREFKYDAMGNLIETNDYDKSGNLKSKSKYKYNAKGQKFCKTKYYPSGEREERQFYYYDALGKVIVVSTVNAGNVLQQYDVYIRDEQGRILRTLTYDGCLLLNSVTDRFYTGSNTDYSTLVVRENPMSHMPDDSVTIDDNGVIHQAGRTMKYDANGIVSEIILADDEQTVTDNYVDGVLRSISIESADGSKHLYTFNKFGDPEIAEMMGSNTGDRQKATYTYNSNRMLTMVDNPIGKYSMEIAYDKSGRLETIKERGAAKSLVRTITVHYTNNGSLDYAWINMNDPAKADERDEMEMEDSHFEGLGPDWWIDGMFHTKIFYKFTYNENNFLTDCNNYGHGSSRNVWYEYRADQKGNWIYQLEKEKESGKPVSITERKIYYR